MVKYRVKLDYKIKVLVRSTPDAFATRYQRARSVVINPELVVSWWVLVIIIGGSCTPGSPSEDRSALAEQASALSGEKLARQHCASCHAYVGPEMLPRAVWADVLTDMGHRMGVYENGAPPDSLFEAGIAATLVKQAKVYPSQPTVSPEAWRKLRDYYQQQAPESLVVSYRTIDASGRLPFRYRPSRFSQSPPLTNLVKILPGRGVVFGDGKRDGSSFNQLDTQLRRTYDIRLPTTPVHLREKDDTVYLTTIGRKMLPSDQPEGAVQQLFSREPDRPPTSARLLLRDMQRPVHTAYADLNQDGREDIVVCEFGNLVGKLAWYENTGNGNYTPHVLKSTPGATRVLVRDINNDGQPDLLVLMAQGDEGIYLFANQNGNFTEKRLLRFPPVYGSTYFDLVDFNGDGHLDILYTCGDNADLSPVLKEFHGIYLFTNDGAMNFTQAYFFPLHGAYKALTEDYDQDGDLDIAAISFFPDYEHSPEESFVYLENQGDLRFQAASFPEVTRGRWIVMDSGDLDQDGDIDLALGSFVGFSPEGDTTGLYEQWLKSSPSVVVLENTTH